MKTAKHYLLCAMLITICTVMTLSAVAMRTVEIVDYVRASDIRAFIDGYEIPSYNISDRLGIVAEDLRGYGFDVVWDGEARTLNITRNNSGISAPVDMSTVNTKKNASRPVYSTDIVTYIDGEEVTTFNIGGYTIIYLRELERYGNCHYDHCCGASMVSTARHSFEKTTIDDLPATIIHAGGEINNVLGTNSREALDTSYSKGYRVIEMDFVLSSDGHPVCLHDWSKYYSTKLSETPISKTEFEKIKIFEVFTTMTLDSLAEWMKTYEDVYIVTDIKENNVDVLRLIAKKHPEIISRIIPQIYQYDEYLPVRALGYSNIILTVYKFDTYYDKANAERISSFAKKNGLLAVTADKTLANADYVKKFTEKGVPLYVHTVNAVEDQIAFLNMGVVGVYTDYAK